MVLALAQRIPRTCLFAAALVMGWMAAATPCAADEFTQRVNDIYKSIQQDKRSDLVLLPLMAKIQPGPFGDEDDLDAALMTPASTRWTKALEWAMAEPQRAVIEAVKKVTAEENLKLAYAFAQPYGSDVVDPDLVGSKMYTELGEPPTLAMADFLYLPAVSGTFRLLQVEATRLQAEGKPAEALDIMMASLHFARQIADREFLKEKAEGLGNMYLAIMRLRDIVYLDSKLETPKLTAENLRDLIRRLQDNRACLSVDKIQLPRGDQIAAEQMISRVFLARSGANPETFAPALARIGARNRPLRLFSESAKWDALRTLHANDMATREQLANVFNDWNKRWKLDPFDAMLKLETDYRKMDKTRFAMIDLILGSDMEVLFIVRRLIEVEVVGTRQALAMQGFHLQQRTFPLALTAVRPTFMTKLDLDPFDVTRKNNLQFFVPMRDRPAGPNEAPKPHEMEVFPDIPGPIKWAAFSVRLRDDGFVIYSVGPDGQNNGCRKATGMIENDKGDYLYWPPVISLLRQNLTESGRLK